MPIQAYGVFRGSVRYFEAERDQPERPHFRLGLSGAGETWRCDVNLRSQRPPHSVAYVIAEQAWSPALAAVAALPEGYTPLKKKGDPRRLDYLRQNLFPFDALSLKPAEEADLGERLEALFRAVSLAKAEVLAFGEPYGDKGGRRGMHRIHMNQGSHADFRADDGVAQDGALLIRLGDEEWRLVAFLFQSQALDTNATGHARLAAPRVMDLFAGAPTGVAAGTVRIAAAMVNPVGDESHPDHDGAPEGVTLKSLSPRPIDLSGWRIETNRGFRRLRGPVLAPGETLRLSLWGDPPLSNRGGAILLLDRTGRVIDRARYSEAQARREGQIIAFPLD